MAFDNDSAFTKGFKGCMGVGCAGIVLIGGVIVLLVLLGSCGTSPTPY